MFEQSFVHATANPHRGAPVALSLLLQMSVIGTAVLIPLINPDLLPTALISNTLFLAPPTPPPAPPPQIEGARTVARLARNIWNGALLMPPRIPDTIKMIDEPPEISTGVGVVGAVPNGSGGGENSVLNSLLNGVARTIAPPPAAPTAVKETDRAKPTIRYRVGGKVQDAMLVSRKLPDYPAMARSMRIEGTVIFHAVIGATGAIQQLQLVSGHPLLVQAAMDAVRQWRYRPTLLNGDPVEVDTVISVGFTLSR